MGKKYSEGKDYKVVAFVLACFSNDEQVRYITRVAKECGKYNCKVVFFSTVTDFYYDDLIDAGEKNIFSLVAVERYDAIILLSESFKQDKEQLELVKRANEAGVPIFAVDKCFDGCINITFDYGNCFREIVKHMIEGHGFKTVNFMGGIPGNSYSEERLGIYKEVLEENGIDYDARRVYYGYFWEDPTMAALDQMFQDMENGMTMPEAIICANDAMALTVVSYLRKKGYRIPEDVAVSGFDAMEMELYSNPRLTTGVYNMEEMLRVVFQRIKDGDFSHGKEPISIYNRMQIGCSCGCDGIKAKNISDEMRKLKADIHLLMAYQTGVNQMVAQFGNIDQLEVVVRAIPDYMTLLRYKDFWLGFDETFMKYMGIEGKVKLGAGVGADKEIGMLHYRMKELQGVLKDWGVLQQSELIPQREAYFDENDFCMVNVLHMHGVKVGYTVIGFDTDMFNYMAYSPFLTNLRHLLELQQTQRQIMRIYERDQLTNLYNRTGFYKYVKKIMETERDKKLTIIFIDMDGLKKVNDTYGHAEGDEALVNIGRIIRESTGEEITARIGGDEFLIAFAGKDNTGRVKEICDLIIQGLDAYNQTSKKSYTLRASIGIFTDAVRNHSLDYFLKQADDMMYVEKSKHKEELENTDK